MTGTHPGSRPRPATRRAASLVELLATMTAASVVMAAAVGLLHRSYAFESRSRHALADERAALRLARQFRADAHAARGARCAAADRAWLVVLEGRGATITYAPTAKGIERVVTAAEGPPSRDDFAFSRGAAWAAHQAGGLVSLSGSSAQDGGRRPRLVLDIVAALDTAPSVPRGSVP